MIERELRKVCYYKTFAKAKTIFKKIIQKAPRTTYEVHYLDSFRIKLGRVEHKQILSKHAFYCDKVWFQYVVSRETAYEKWSLALHKKFTLHQSVVTEYRLETEPSRGTKFYAFKRTDGKCGLAFETEDCRRLRTYSKFYRCLASYQQEPSTKYLCRKPVLHGTCHDDCFVAPKYDGIFGYVLCHSDFICEKWEDGESKTIQRETIYPGLVFSAERLPSGIVVLLDVLSVGDLPTYRKDVRHILNSFMKHLARQRLPQNYIVQKYDYTLDGPIDMTDGVIYHTFNDQIYKSKFVNTVELYYENGFLRSFSQRFYPRDCKIELIEGCIYECQLTDADSAIVHCRRKDRFVCNSDEQIANALGK